MRETKENKKGNAAIIEGESEFSSRIALYRPKMNAIQNKIADFLLQDEKPIFFCRTKRRLRR